MVIQKFVILNLYYICQIILYKGFIMDYLKNNFEDWVCGFNKDKVVLM